MSNQPLVLICCEASPARGAGHAIRCSVLADALFNKGWKVKFVTTDETYEFIPSLSRFERIDPHAFYEKPIKCDMLIIDNYDLDDSYEKHFRSFAKKILVIDDLANRSHDCDILVDQTYGRKVDDYRSLVPNDCEILTGSDYILLRPEFIKLRTQAVEKRKNTKEIKKILISMGGSDPKNYTLKALELIKNAGFNGMIDIVLGFTAPYRESIKSFISSMPNQVTIHTNANMAQLTYEADLAIGASGTSVWERCFLGLPSILMKTADNQNLIYDNLINDRICFTKEDLAAILRKNLPLPDLFAIFKREGITSLVDNRLSHVR